MPTELEELVEFVSHGNTQIRQLAVENLVPYSLSQPSIFKTNQLLPVKDLKLLVRDYKKIAKDAITILINLTADREILEYLATDMDFVKTLLSRVTNPKEPNANEISMLLANLVKHDALLAILSLKIPAPPELHSNTLAIDQLLDLFVRGADGSYNPDANFDYLSYLFADLAKHASGRDYLLTKQPYDSIVPLSKLVVFTEHGSHVRRRGVASTIKNTAFETASHPQFLAEEDINILPYLLLPIMGSEEYDDDDSANMLPDLQLLPEDKKRESDATILQTHVETLMLLTTTRPGRDVLRDISVYPIVRETHLHVEDDGVREACERLVQVLMRDEEGEEGKSTDNIKALERPGAARGGSGKPFGRLQAAGGAGSWAQAEPESEDEDDKIVEV